MKSLRLAIISIALIFSFEAAAEEEKEPFVSAFSATCVKYYNSQKQLRKKAEANWSPLARDYMSPIKRNYPNDIWVIEVDGKGYFLTLGRDGSCSISTPVAMTKNLHSEFNAALKVAPEPLISKQVQETQSSGSGATETSAWQWSAPGDKTGFTFILVTSDDPHARYRAIASMIITEKSN